MNKIKKILLSGLMLLTSIMPSTIPIHANENVSLKVSVVGDGSITVINDELEETVTSEKELSLNVMKDTKMDFVVSSNLDKFSHVTINQQKVELTKKTDAVAYLTHSINKNEEIVFNFKEKEKFGELVIGNFLSHSEPIPEVIQTILDDYDAGNKMKPEYVQARKIKAEEMGALSYVDENYFIKKEHYNKVILIENMGGFILLDPDVIYESELSKDEPSLLSLDAPKVTSTKIMDKVTIYFSSGFSTWAAQGNWKVDGHQAICGNAFYAGPETGDIHKPAKLVTNENVRKMMYYGFGGPKDKLTNQYNSFVKRNLTESEAVVITSDLVSYYLGNGSLLEYVGGDTLDYVKDYAKFMNDPKLTVPDSFKVYIADSKGKATNWQGIYIEKQPLVFGINQPKGELQIKKESANPSATDNNNCYSLEGAEYGVYKTKKDDKVSDKVGTLTIGKDGWSNKLSLDAGTFYIQEVKSPTGYELDTTIYTITVSSGTLTTKTYKDNPLMDPVTIMVGKIDKETSLNLPQGSGSFENAQFTVKYYKGNYNEGVDPATEGVTPTKQWVLKTDKDGYARLGDEFKVSGDDFYYNAAKVPSLPDGTLTIQEKIPPQGYKLNDELFIKKLTYGASNKVNVFHAPTVPETVIKFHLQKIQEGTNLSIPDASFIHTKPNGTTETLTTDANGFITIVGLETGIHKLKESGVQDGLLVNPNEFKFEILIGGTVKVHTTNLEDKGMYYELLSNGNGQITIEDKTSPYDFSVYKINEKGSALDGAEFTLYSDAACTKKIKTLTTQNGVLTFPKLDVKTKFYLKETKAPQGYRIPVDSNGKVHIYEFYIESVPQKNIFNVYVDGVKYTASKNNVQIGGTKANRIVTLTVTNYTTIKLPKTGSNKMIPLLLFGTFMMGSAIFMSKKRKDNQ